MDRFTNYDQKFSEMRDVIEKGQPFAKRNKERRLRKLNREMFEIIPDFEDIRILCVRWLKKKFKRSEA